MKLMYFPGTISVAVAIALEEAGLAHDLVKVDFKQAEQTKPEYHHINPKGRVPALVTGDAVLTETGAILDYIAALVPEQALIPTDPMAAFRVREAMYYLAGTMHVNHAHKMRGHRWADQQDSWTDMTAKVTETMTDCARHVEDHVLQSPYVCGDIFSIADAYLYPVCLWLPGDKVDLAPFPKIRAFMAAMADRPAVQRVKANGVIPG